jgi:hypothetical protein
MGDCAVQIQCLCKKRRWKRRARGRAGGWRRKRDREQPGRSYGTFSRTKEATIGSDVRRRFIKIRIYRQREAEKGFPAAPRSQDENSGLRDKNTSPLASTPCRLATIPATSRAVIRADASGFSRGNRRERGFRACGRSARDKSGCADTHRRSVVVVVAIQLVPGWRYAVIGRGVFHAAVAANTPR